MKFKINENFEKLVDNPHGCGIMETLLVEGKNIERTWDANKDYYELMYKEKAREVFDQVIACDPTYKGGNTTGTYGDWMVRHLVYEHDKSVDQSIAELCTAVREFDKNKKYIANKDINSYNSIDDLFIVSELAQPSKRQQERDQKNNSNNVRLLYEDDDWEIYEPMNYAGAVYLGKGTHWCTAAQSEKGLYYYVEYTGDTDAFKTYSMGTPYEQWMDELIDNIKDCWEPEDFDIESYALFGPLYVVINKHDPSEKYQLHFETDSFMDAKDNEIDLYGEDDTFSEGVYKFFGI